MSVFAPIKKQEQARIPNSQYSKIEGDSMSKDKGRKEVKKPKQPKAKV